MPYLAQLLWRTLHAEGVHAELAQMADPTQRETDTLYSGFTVPNQSPFFTRLPFEIRQMILEEAFGQRVLHIRRTASKFSQAHARQGVEPVHLRMFRKSGEKTESSDRWVSCMCHRSADSPPVYDSCLDDHECEGPGALGWLLSCRQR